MKKVLVVLILLQITPFLFPFETIKGLYWGRGTLVLDTEGNFYLGYDDHSIVKYAPDGKELLKMGQKGEGPGDFKRLWRYAFNPQDNLLYVTEYFEGNPWISRFTSAGKFAGEWNYQRDKSKPVVASEITFDSQGNLVIKLERSLKKRFKDFTLGIEDSELVKFSPAGKRLLSYYNDRYEVTAFAIRNTSPTIPFLNYRVWKMYQDKIVTKETAGNIINIYSPSGKLEKQIPFPAKKEKVTGKDIDAWEESLCAQDFYKKGIAEGWINIKFWKERLPFPEYKPNTSWGMHIDTQGNLYLQEYVDYENREPHWYRVNLENGKIDKIKFIPGQYLALVWNNYFFFASYNEETDETILTKVPAKDLPAMLDPDFK